MPDDREPVASTTSRASHPALRGLVGDYQGYRYTADPPSVHHGLPGTTLTMVLAFDAPLDVGWLGEPDTRRAHWAMLSGLGVDPAAVYQSGVEQGIQLELTPVGARVLFGLPAAAIRREIVPVDLLPGGGGGLHERVASGCSWQHRFDALDAVLLSRLAHASASARLPDPGVRHAWDLVHRSGGAIRVGTLADQLGWSRRRLHERFDAEFGLAPKQAARLVRFGRARRLFTDLGVPLAEVAARCGYADQAHLTRDWRALAGVTPTAWLAEVRSILQDDATRETAESTP
jgi:AraC-like DNA-binding protein